MIIVPMAGVSRRFSEAGYARPKYELPLDGRPVFHHAVESFRAYFAVVPFLFIVGPIPGASAYVRAACAEMGIADVRVVALDRPTAGQAETVERGLALAAVGEDKPLTIFNIDTFRPGFHFPAAAWTGPSDGWLEVFEGAGDNWSYVRPMGCAEPLVEETAEKRPISTLCCTGLYHFERAEDFVWALGRERAEPQAAELYVAPLYNHLIRQGRRIHYHPIPPEAVIFCGTPGEYRALGGSLPT